MPTSQPVVIMGTIHCLHQHSTIPLYIKQQHFRTLRMQFTSASELLQERKKNVKKKSIKTKCLDNTRLFHTMKQ